jgi:hypothetical protein
MAKGKGKKHIKSLKDDPIGYNDTNTLKNDKINILNDISSSRYQYPNYLSISNSQYLPIPYIFTISDSKRSSACSLLANIYSSNVFSSIITKFTSVELLSKLNMRLVDYNMKVKVEAIKALMNALTLGFYLSIYRTI